MAGDIEHSDSDNDLEDMEKNSENLSAEDSSNSMSDFDFCEDFESVDKNVAETVQPKSETSSWTSSFDFCEEFDDVQKMSAAENVKSEAESSGTSSDNEKTDSESYASADTSESIDMDVDYDGMGKTQFSRTLEEEIKTDYEFRKMLLTRIVKERALPLLPAKPLIRFKSVAKEWDQWITSPFLVHNQSYRFCNMSGYFYEGFKREFVSVSGSDSGIPDPSLSFLPENVSVISSSHGLLLCKSDVEIMTYYVCNPATRKWKQLPSPNFYHGEHPSVVLAFKPSYFNIGYHYHVVCAFTLLDQPGIYFETYSSETNTWKLSNEFCTELEDATLETNGFHSNGIIYWKTTLANEVLAFDIKNEINGILPLPSLAEADCGALSEMNGTLHYVCGRNLSGGLIEVYIYGGNGGIDMHLKKSQRFNLGTKFNKNCRVLPSLCADTVVVLIGGTIYYCNLNEQKVKVVRTSGILPLMADYLPYVNSLVDVA